MRETKRARTANRRNWTPTCKTQMRVNGGAAATAAKLEWEDGNATSKGRNRTTSCPLATGVAPAIALASRT